MLVQLQKIKEKQKNEILQVVIAIDNKQFADYNLCGKTSLDRVEQSVNHFSYIEILVNKDNFIQDIKSNLGNKEYTLVIFGTCPLITRAIIDDILDYCLIKNIDACELPKGLIFKTEYLKNNNTWFFDSQYCKNQDCFIELNHKSEKYILQIISDNIKDKHIKAGVQFFGDNIQIDENVEILSGAQIYANNVIKGNTVIGNCVIKENNVITDSIILDNAVIASSVILNTRVGMDTFITNFSSVENCEIGDNCVIQNINLKDKKVLSNSNKIKE